MEEVYIAAAIGGIFGIIGALSGVLVQSFLRRSELNRIEIFQQKLSDQTKELQEQQHDAEMKKMQKIFEMLKYQLGSLTVELKKQRIENPPQKD